MSEANLLNIEICNFNICKVKGGSGTIVRAQELICKYTNIEAGLLKE